MTTLVLGEIARGSRIMLREKRLGDAVDDYRWRSEPDLARYDAARPLTMDFQEFLALYREEVLYPSAYRHSLAIEDETGRHIGNVMYYNIDTLHQEVELGITIGEPHRWGEGYGTEAVQLLLEYLVGARGFQRVYLKTLDWNQRAHRAFEKAGFVNCGCAQRNGNTFILMEYQAEWLQEPDRTVRSSDER